MIIRKAEENPLTVEEFRAKIMEAQGKMEAMPEAVFGKNLDKHCPLKHSFGDGVYIREIFMTRGTFIISKIHKFTHPYFVLEGVASVATGNGIELIKAPYQGMTKAGTKRILYIHEDMIWITVHATKETDLGKIENEIISKDFNEFDSFINENIIEAEERELCHGE